MALEYPFVKGTCQPMLVQALGILHIQVQDGDPGKQSAGHSEKKALDLCCY